MKDRYIETYGGSMIITNKLPIGDKEYKLSTSFNNYQRSLLQLNKEA